MLRRVVSKWATRRSRLWRVMVAAAMVLGFALALRYDDLSRITVADVKFLPDGNATVFISSSKTDQLRHGTWRPLAASDNASSPVALLRRLFRETEWTSGYVLRAIARRSATNARDMFKSVLMPYSSFLRLLREALTATGIDASEVASFGAHSLRRGNASHLATRTRVNDQLRREFGRWRSADTADAYVEVQHKRLMGVARSLRL